MGPPLGAERNGRPARGAHTDGRSEGSLRLLGGFHLLDGGCEVGLPLGVQRIVALLALADRPLPRTAVAGTLWSDVPQQHANACLRSALWRLRSHVDVIDDRDDRRLTLRTGLRVDARAVEREARGVIVGDQPLTVPVTELCEPLLPDWCDDWVVIQRERLRQLCAHALEAWAETMIEQQRFAAAIEAALTAIDLEGLRESAHRVLIRAHIVEGNYAEALAQYDRFRRLLDAELGLEPSPLLEEMMRPVLPR